MSFPEATIELSQKELEATLPHRAALQEYKGGFDFSLSARNISLGVLPRVCKIRKTGTTICGVTTPYGLVLAADTRSTMGYTVADKNCRKLHRLSPQIWAAGAGNGADLEYTLKMLGSKLELQRLTMRTEPRVIAATTALSQQLFRYQGYVVCAVVLGGIDPVGGAQLFQISPHGSYFGPLPYAAMGSGSLSALQFLETGYRPDLSLEEAKALAAKAIRGGIFNDLGSGGNVDIVAISSAPGATVEFVRGYDIPDHRSYE